MLTEELHSSERFIFWNWAFGVYLCRCGWIDKQNMTTNPFLIEFVIKILLWSGTAAAVCLLVSFGPMPLLKKSHSVSICGIADQSVTATGSRQSTTLPHVLDIGIQCSFEVLLLPPPLVVALLHFPVRQLLKCSWALHFPPPPAQRSCVGQHSPHAGPLATFQFCAVAIQPPRNMPRGSIHKSRFLKAM